MKEFVRKLNKLTICVNATVQQLLKI